jgi:C1A family cysteine protease
VTQIPPPFLPPRRLGWVKDPEDARDVDAVKALRAESYPPSFSNRDLVMIVDQGQLGSCTANASGQAIRAATIIEVVELLIAQGWDAAAAMTEALAKVPFISRLFTYYLARAYEGTQHEDVGTYIRLIFQVINKYGFCAESVWPYSDATNPGAPFSKMPSANAFREAYDQRSSAENRGLNLVSYSRIMGSGSTRIATIKSALAQRHLVAFGTPVTDDFCNSVGVDAPIERPTIGQKIAGGHAMCLVGYDGDTFEVANSWGTGFGDQGFVKFARSYIEWSETDDLWIVKRTPILKAA